jgi:hypothetical protein
MLKKLIISFIITEGSKIVSGGLVKGGKQQEMLR